MRTVTAYRWVVQTSVISLRRYPVKSMGGESIETAEVDTRGLVGDRSYAVEDDDGSVSIVSTATMLWCSEHRGGSLDPRRLRVNVVLGSDEPFVEEQRVGREIEIGSARLRVVQRIPRCRMIDISQDGVDPGVQWLKTLTQERDMCLAVYADVTRPGRIGVGDRPRPV